MVLSITGIPCPQCYTIPCRCPQWVYTPPRCEHCFCKPSSYPDDPPHRSCCKCLTIMAEMFIPAFRLEKE